MALALLTTTFTLQGSADAKPRKATSNGSSLISPLGVPAEPYVTSALPPNDLSFYQQPWRSYLETVPAVRFLNGLGVGYNELPGGTDHAAAVAELAAAGFRSVRIELNWDNLSWDETWNENDGSVQAMRAVLAAAKVHGITPLVVLNANHGSPVPHLTSTRTLVSAAAAGSRSVTLDSVTGLVAKRSGISDLAEAVMADVLITAIDPATKVVTLSKPLPVALAAGATVEVDTLKYLPLHPVGTPQFDETAAGWLRYTQAVLDLLAQSGFSSYDLEIWNELGFGSNFLNINNYYDPPVATFTVDPVHPGGQAWELARRTTALVEQKAPAVRVVWGFSNTSFFKTPVADLPPGTDGQSYHPYHTRLTRVPSEFPSPEDVKRYVEGYVPRVDLAVPEGQTALGIMTSRLARLLTPSVRTTQRPAGTTQFSHYMTEHGFSPALSGVTDPARAWDLKAKALLRSTTFWLNKGITRMEVSKAWQPNETGFGLLPPTRPSDFAEAAPGALTTPPLRALRNLVGTMAGAAPIATPRSLGVSVTALGAQPVVFAGDATHPPLYARDLFAFLPYQVSPTKFVVPTYVLTYNLNQTLPDMQFALKVSGIKGTPKVSLYDPITNASVPLSGVAASGGELSLTMTAKDYPRLLVIEE